MRFSGSIPAILAVLLLGAPATAWGANLLSTTSFTNSAGESCVKQSFDDGSDIINCVGTSEVEIIDVPVPPPPGQTATPPPGGVAEPVPESFGAPAASPTSTSTTTSTPDSPTSSTPAPPKTTSKRPAGQSAIEADTERRKAGARAKGRLGYEDAGTSEGDEKPKPDPKGLSDQIKRLGQKLSVTKEPPKNIVIPGGGESFGGNGEKDTCEDCKYKITSIIDELKGLELPAGFPTLKVEDLNYLSGAERAGNIRAFAKIQDAMGKLAKAVEVAGGLMTGGVAVAAIELGGFLFGENFANPGDLFKNPEALARGISIGIEKITITMPVFVVDARYFNILVCVKGAWRPFKGLYFKSEGPRKRETVAPDPQKDYGGTVADLNRLKLEKAISYARDEYKNRVRNAALLRAFLKNAKDTTPSSCKLQISESDFYRVPPVGAKPTPPKKKKKDCSHILEKIKRAEKEKAALEDQRAALEGNKAFLKERLANTKAKLARARGELGKTESKIRQKRGNRKSVTGMLDGLRGKAAGGGVLTPDENASLDRLTGLDRQYRDEIEALESARAALQTQVESFAGAAEDAEAGLRGVAESIKAVAADIAKSAAAIDSLNAEYERCKAENG